MKPANTMFWRATLFKTKTYKGAKRGQPTLMLLGGLARGVSVAGLVRGFIGAEADGSRIELGSDVVMPSHGGLGPCQ